MKYNWKRNCKSFMGNHACDMVKYNNMENCEACNFYEQYTKKILIIKLGATGDVLRTTTLLQAIKAKYGNPIIYWLTTEYNKAILENNTFVDKILVHNNDTILRIQQEKFDVLYSLETDTPGTLLANLVKAEEKYGYYFHEDGHPATFNQAADYYLETQFSERLNKENRKTYQEMMFEAMELKYNKEDYILRLGEKELNYAKNFYSIYGITEKDFLIGINLGAGTRWPSKNWNKDKILELIKRIKRESNYKIIILGGQNEEKTMAYFMEQLRKESMQAIFNNPNNSLREFISLINRCDIVITMDSLAMHIALALKKKTVALFFTTPPWEIEEYGRIKKISSPLLDKHYFIDEHNEELSNSIKPNDVLLAIQEIIRGEQRL